MNSKLTKTFLGKPKKMSTYGKTLAGLALAGCMANAYAVAPLSVNGNKVLAGGKPASFAGMSLFESCVGWGGERFYNAGTVSWLKNDWKANLVRAAMCVENAGGYASNPGDQANRVKTVVDAAIANDMYVIADFHSHHAEDYTAKSIAFFQDMARTYGNTNNIIYEVYNEPLNTTDWHNTIKPYAQQVVNAIRAIDPDNLIIVGTQTWSQDVDKAALDPVSGNNIAYTLHFYANQKEHQQPLRNKAQAALNTGAALFVTEWGTVDASGDGQVNQSETNAWMDLLKQNNISMANWALSDKNEGSAALTGNPNSNGGWTNNQLTVSGSLVRSIIQGWPKYDGGTSSSTRTSTTTTTSSATTSSAANYNTINSTVQAENYASMSGIQTENTSDVGGGINVGWIDAGDWMSYPFNIPATGTYTVSYRVASQNGGGVIRFQNASGNPSFGTVNVPSTGGWQNWVTITQVVNLQAGQQTLSINAVTGGFNVNWFKIEPVSVPSSSAVPTTSSYASTSKPPLSSSSVPTTSSSVPTTSSSISNTSAIATVEAENYSFMSGVQTENTSDVGGGMNVGWMDAGDWISYANAPVNIPSTGTYTVEFRVAGTGNGQFTFEEAGGNPVFATINTPNTGGWQNWTTVRATVNLTGGDHRFGLGIKAGGFNLNWFKIYGSAPVISSVAPSSVKSSTPTTSSTRSISSTDQCPGSPLCPSSSSVKSSVAPSSVAPSSVAPSSVAPSSVAPSSVAPSSVVPSSVKSSSVPSSIKSSSGVTSSSGPVVHLENPFVDAQWYLDPIWTMKAMAEPGGSKVAIYNTAIWMDRIGAIAPTEVGSMGLREHLNAALNQGANLILVVIYDLPNRDCNALASNGELLMKENGIARYKTEYIDPIAAIFADPAYSSLRIVTIIEPDSLPNLVTNTSVAKCQEAAGAGGYVDGTRYTLNKFYPIRNVYTYMDIGHSGWLGWDTNITPATKLIADVVKSTDHGVNSVDGFISNTANTTPLKEPFLDQFSATGLPGANGGDQVRSAKFYEWNPMFSEFSFVNAWRTKMIALGFPPSIGMLVDTSRNGWGGAARPTAVSTSTSLNTFVDQSRVDRRPHRGNWCNQAGAGIGERPQAAPAPGIDAYVWVKPPGESDGASSKELSYDPLDPAKGFDRFCDPTFIIPSINVPTNAMPNAPVAGRWFSAGFQDLMKNAYPPLQ